jgi:TonB family protein
MFQLRWIMRTIISVILGLLFLVPSVSVQAQKSEAQPSRPGSPEALIGLPSATVTTESPGLVATRIVLARYTLPSPDPNLNDTFVIKMRISISESGDVETAKVIKDTASDHGADELYAPALEAIRQWKFEPYAKKGHAKKFATAIFLHFVPNDRVFRDGLEQKPAGAAGQLIEVTDLEAMSTLTRLVVPTYPKEATETRLQGMAVVGVTIGKNGEVADVKQISAHPLIARAAVDAIRQWRFEPYKLNGEPIDVFAKLTVLFIQGEH